MIDLKVSIDGRPEPVEVTVKSRDVATWESEAKRGESRSMADLKDRMSMLSFYQLAHVALRRTGAFTGSLETFMSTADVDFGSRGSGEDAETDPSSREV